MYEMASVVRYGKPRSCHGKLLVELHEPVLRVVNAEEPRCWDCESLSCQMLCCRDSTWRARFIDVVLQRLEIETKSQVHVPRMSVWLVKHHGWVKGFLL